MVGSTKIADSQTLTATYALTSTLTEFEINAESEGTIDVLYTTGAAETNNYLNFKIEYSPDSGTTWIPESYDAIASGVNTLGELEHKIDGAAAGTTYKRQYMLPFCSKKIRVYIKETGVVANFGTATVYLSVTSRNRQSRNPSQVSVSITGVATETTLAALNAKVITDTDDDDIAKSQVLPLGIAENYIYSKTADNWVRLQGTDDGIPFARVIGMYTDSGDSVMDDVTDTVKVSGSISATCTNSGIFVVQENGAALTALQSIDGDVATIAGDTTSIDSKITACNTGAVVVASGAITETNSGSIKTAVEAINTKMASGTDIGDVTINNANGAAAVNIQDGGNSLTVDNGGTFAVQPGSSLTGPGNPTVDSYATVAINLTTGADQVLVSSAANKQIWVYGYAFTCGDADGQTVSLQDEDNTAITGIMEFSRYGGISVPPSGNFSMPVFKLATDKDLEIDITGGDVDGWISYAIISI